MRNKKLKISYLFFALFVLTVSTQSVFAHEIIKAQEISVDSKDVDIKSKPKLFRDVNLLGETDLANELDPNREEVRIKSIGQILSERKAKKEAAKKAKTTKEKKSDLVINCTEMDYNPETNELIANGNVEIITPEGVRVTSDNAVYNKENDTIKLVNNVVLHKTGTTVTGDYMLIDLNEENALMDSPVTKVGNIVINAEEGYAYSDKIENLNGNIELNERLETGLYSDGFTKYGRAIPDERLVDFNIKKQRSKPYSFKAKEIEIVPEKDHDSLLLKDAVIYYNDRRIMNVPSLEFFTDKEMTRNEMNIPLEFGSLKGFGTFVGLGYTFKLPKSYTFRLTPAFVYADDTAGGGVMAKLLSDIINLDGGWGASTNDFIIDGNTILTDKINWEFGRLVYKGEWFNGGNRSGYQAELVYDDSFLVKDLGDAVFRHRLSAGYVADYRKRHQEDDMHDGARFRYQAQFAKDLFTIGSKEQDMYITLGGIAQTMATLYSQGNTVGLFRGGPMVQSKLKRWNSNILYTFGGVHGQTPYLFDEYRYGRQSVSFDESLILNKYLSIGYRGTLTPLKDNREKELLTENRFYAVAGPEDFKLAFSYDTIRQNMHFDFLFLIGADNIDVKYEKLTINDPDKLGKHQRKESDKDLYKVKIPENL